MSSIKRSDNPHISKRLLILNLSFITTERDLYDVFSKYGHITHLKTSVHPKTGRPRGFGYVRYEHKDDAVYAKYRADGLELDGRRIETYFASRKSRRRAEQTRKTQSIVIAHTDAKAYLPIDARAHRHTDVDHQSKAQYRSNSKKTNPKQNRYTITTQGPSKSIPLT